MSEQPSVPAASGTHTPTVGAVIIGRNEGERLVECLKSMAGHADRIVYVDSGSSDNSVAEAGTAGAIVVELDLSRPFTAARARNAGFAELTNTPEPPDYVQFVDGDCRLQPGWLQAAGAELASNDTLAIVTGWRSEIHRDRSVYNALCDVEWRRPAGDIITCGGDMMVRREAFTAVGGFDSRVIAAEDDEFCVRIRKAGWGIRRIPVEMTSHDAAMLNFGQWWQRAVRSGHGFAQVGDLHSEYFTTERRRVLFYGVILPVTAAAGLAISWWITLAALALYGASFARTAWGINHNGLPAGEAAAHAGLLTLSKFPNVIGMATYWRRRLRGSDMEIIEYK